MLDNPKGFYRYNKTNSDAWKTCADKYLFTGGCVSQVGMGGNLDVCIPTCLVKETRYDCLDYTLPLCQKGEIAVQKFYYYYFLLKGSLLL